MRRGLSVWAGTSKMVPPPGLVWPPLGESQVVVGVTQVGSGRTAGAAMLVLASCPSNRHIPIWTRSVRNNTHIPNIYMLMTNESC